MERQEKLERVASTQFVGLLLEYHKKMAEAMIHALANWIPKEHIDDALNDVRYYSEQVLKEIEMDASHSRLGRYVG